MKHKNHISLIEAVHNLNNEGVKINLICTGNKTEYYENVLTKEVEGMGLEGIVKFLGIIPESDLMSLYKLTSLVIIPSKYEAGSAPLYEAMRFGTGNLLKRNFSTGNNCK